MTKRKNPANFVQHVLKPPRATTPVTRVAMTECQKLIRRAVQGEKLRVCSQFYGKLNDAIKALEAQDLTTVRRKLCTLRLEVQDVIQEDVVPLRH